MLLSPLRKVNFLKWWWKWNCSMELRWGRNGTHLDVAELLPASLQPTQQSQVRLLSARRLQQSVVNRNRLPQGRPVAGPRRPASFSQGEAARTPTTSSSSSPPRHWRRIRWPEVALHRTWTRETRDNLMLLYTTHTHTHTKVQKKLIQQPVTNVFNLCFIFSLWSQMEIFLMEWCVINYFIIIYQISLKSWHIDQSN